jgi:hypothetical protein
MSREFPADYSGVDPRAGGGIPEKTKALAKIVRAEPAVARESGNRYVSVDWRIVAGPYAGRDIKYQNVVFLPREHKSAGMVLHFLKSIRQDYEGKFTVNVDAWLDKHAWITTGIDKKDDGREFAKVSYVECPELNELIELGEITSADELPESAQWLVQEQEGAQEVRATVKAGVVKGPTAAHQANGKTPQGSAKAAVKAKEAAKPKTKRIDPF